MPVFLSHTRADNALARQVYDQLTVLHRIECYLDDLDAEAGAANATNRVTSLILNGLSSCTTLLAIVTMNTRASWWVPFEIGVARQAPRTISTFTDLSSSLLPQYLTEWPVLRGSGALDHFAHHYHSQSFFVKRAFIEEAVAPSTGRRSVDEFHRGLRATLGQS